MRRPAFLVAFLGSCALPPVVPVPPDVAHQRAALTHLLTSTDATARQCTAYAQWLARGDATAKDRATELYTVCARRLMPVVDAIHVAVKSADPWATEAQRNIACAGETVRVAFEALRDDFGRLGATPPELMADGIEIGAEVGAGATCDPLHPTTTVTVTFDPHRQVQP